jgi:hypothetical protein
MHHEPPELDEQAKLRDRFEHSRQRSPQAMQRIAYQLQKVDEKIEQFERDVKDESSVFIEPVLSYLTELAQAHGRVGLLNHSYTGDIDTEHFEILGEISGGLELLTGRHFPADMLVWVNVEASGHDQVRSSKR